MDALALGSTCMRVCCSHAPFSPFCDVSWVLWMLSFGACVQDRCLGIQGVYRISFALAVYFLAMAILAK